MADKPQWPPNDCSLIDTGDTAWIMTSMALVLFMTPGLAFFYGGLVHRFSVLTIIMQCFISMGVTSFVWIIIGFSLAFGEDHGGVIGNPASYPMFTNMDLCTPTGYPMSGSNGTMPGLLFAGYQMMFAIISPALITGAFADRVKFKSYLVFIFFWIILVYCPFAHWCWSPNGWLNVWGVKDFAGGIVVHISAGFAALASIFVVGSRAYDSEEDRHKMQVPHNRTFVALGTGMLWFGWFGFNGGSALASGGQAVFACVNTTLAGSFAMCFWMVIEWFHVGKPTLVGACVGSVAGLATITPAAGFVRPWAASVIGTLTAFGCYGCIVLRDVLKWDDALDVWGVHGMGGLFGTLMLGFLADEGIGGKDRGGVFFGKQLTACIWTAFYSFVVSYLLLKIINIFLPIVPDRSELAMGLDVSLHGEMAYDDENVGTQVSRSDPKNWDDVGNVQPNRGLAQVEYMRAQPVHNAIPSAHYQQPQPVMYNGNTPQQVPPVPHAMPQQNQNQYVAQSLPTTVIQHSPAQQFQQFPVQGMTAPQQPQIYMQQLR